MFGRSSWFEDGVSNAEIARTVGVCAESVRRWRRVWEQGGARPCDDGQPPDAHPSWTTPRSRRSGPRWSKVPRPVVSRPTCGPWSESARSSPGQRGCVVEGVGVTVADRPARMESAASRAAGGREGRVGDRPLDRARVAAHQKGP